MAPMEGTSLVPKAVPGTLAMVASLLARARRYRREVLVSNEESSVSNSGALVTAQGSPCKAAERSYNTASATAMTYIWPVTHNCGSQPSSAPG